MGQFLNYLKKSTREMILILLAFFVVLVVFFKVLPQDKSPTGTYPLKVLELPGERHSIRFDRWPNPKLTYQGIDTIPLFRILQQPAGLPEMALIHFYQPGYRDSAAVHAVWDMWQKKGMRRIEVALADSVDYPVWHFTNPTEKTALARFINAVQPDAELRDFTLLYLHRYPKRLYFTAGPMDVKSVNIYLTREFRGQF